ncbi:hypothetical protein WUBG_03212 [Wuchereria bancrofti]|uniref:Uncharacterized protein n=1 Tax=Wuchereria bancrofti TaxID=6293 RepID=J9FEU4_WUCBA|nr:hypothetical protein WUBG_03212 [Wuchereria bancrofti]VDM09158.1 unnamed protein product [Wuchereria bancrofti]
MYNLYIEIPKFPKICVKRPEVKKCCECTLWDTFVALSSLGVLHSPIVLGEVSLVGGFALLSFLGCAADLFWDFPLFFDEISETFNIIRTHTGKVRRKSNIRPLGLEQ